MNLFKNEYEIKKDVLPLSILKTSMVVILLNGLIIFSFVFFVRFKNVIKVQSEVMGHEPSLTVIVPKTGVVVFDGLVNSQPILKNQIIGYYEQNSDLLSILNTNEYLSSLKYEYLLKDPRNTFEKLNSLEVVVEEILSYVSDLKGALLRYSELLTHKRILFEEKEKIHHEQTEFEALELKLYEQQDSLNRELNMLVANLNKRDSLLHIENTISQENIEKKNIESIKEKIKVVGKELEQLTFLHNSSDNKTEYLISNNNYYSELRDIENRIKNILYDLKSRIKIWGNNNTITALDAGIVLFDDSKNRRVVNMNDTLAIISPKTIDRSKYFVRLNIPKKYINYLEVGQKVKTEIDEYPSVEFGIIEGEIMDIPRETSADFYQCKAWLTKGLTTNYGRNIEPKGVAYTGISKISVENESLFEKLKKVLIWKYWDFQK